MCGFITGKSSGTADYIGFFVTVPIAFGAIAMDIFYPPEEYEGHIPAYPYMRMRTRSMYPWGGNGLFEHHPHVNHD